MLQKQYILISSVSVTLFLLFYTNNRAQLTDTPATGNQAIDMNKQIEKARIDRIIDRINATIAIMRLQSNKIMRNIPGLLTLEQKIKKNDDEIYRIKSKYNVLSAEKQLLLLENKLEALYTQLYSDAFAQFTDLNMLLKQALENPTIRSYAQEIRSIKLKMATTIKDTVAKIQEKGKEINIITQKTLQTNFSPLIAQYELQKHKLHNLLLDGKISNELEKYTQENNALKRDMQQMIYELPVADRTALKEIQNSTNQLDFMLKSIKNPRSIEMVTAEDIIELII